jgi:hypothetical protein
MNGPDKFEAQRIDENQQRVIVDMINALHLAIMPFVERSPQDQAIICAIASAAAAQFAGAQYGICCFLNMAQPDGNDLSKAMAVAGLNFRIGIEQGLDFAQRASLMGGANVQ